MIKYSRNLSNKPKEKAFKFTISSLISKRLLLPSQVFGVIGIGLGIGSPEAGHVDDVVVPLPGEVAGLLVTERRPRRLDLVGDDLEVGLEVDRVGSGGGGGRLVDGLLLDLAVEGAGVACGAQAGASQSEIVGGGQFPGLERREGRE